MFPFSFRKYVTTTGMPKEQVFTEFMKTGGIPYVAVLNRTDEKIVLTLDRFSLGNYEEIKGMNVVDWLLE